MNICIGLLLLFLAALGFCRENEKTYRERIDALEREQESMKLQLKELEEKCIGALASGESVDGKLVGKLQDERRAVGRMPRHIHQNRPKGETGVAGSKGDQGIQGQVGAEGPKGEEGPKGQKGEPGSKKKRRRK